MVLRKIAKTLRGRATPEQLVLACVLGSMLGFVPGLERGLGLTLVLTLLLVISNANIGLALLSFLLAKPIGLLALPLSFRAGRFLLDGPTSGLFQKAINAPVLALLGLDYYATTGGLLTGLAFGLLLGVGVALAVQRFRRSMARLEEGSDAYRRFTARRSVKVLTFVLMGSGRGKKSWDEIAARHSRVPLRWSGVALAALAVAGLWALQGTLAGPLTRNALVGGLERANGATVDLAAAELDLAGGRLTLRGLALADPDALDTDLLRADELEGVFSTRDLLRKRLRIERLVVDGARHAAPRARPGVRVGPEKPAPPAPEPRAGETTIEDWIAEAEVWKERLAKAREWLERLEREAPPDSPQAPETLEQRLEREALEKGLAGVRASHLVEDVPLFSIGELRIGGLGSSRLPGEVLSVRAVNLSTEPWLLADAPRLELSSQSGRIEVLLGLDQASADPEQNRLRLAVRDLDGDAVGRALRLGSATPFQGGQIDLTLDGSWSAGGVGRIDLPLAVALRGTTLTLPGLAPTRVERFEVPIGLRGPLDRLAVRFDASAVADALMAAGKDELARRVRGQAEELLDRGRDEARERLEKELEGRLPEGLREEAEQRTKGLLKGLGGTRKSDG